MDRGYYTTMVKALSEVPDPRERRGVRYPWVLLLTLIGAAMVGGQKHGRAIAQWVREHTEVLVGLLEPEGERLPSESTLRRALRSVDVIELEARLAEFNGGVGTNGEELKAQAMDGKQVRGVGAHGRQLHLLSVARHDSGAVLAQIEVDSKENEIAAAPRLLEGLKLSGTVTTTDAMLTQRALARQILGQGGHYLMVVKENQPGILEAISELFEVGSWMPSEVGTRYWRYRSFEKGHGRLEVRILESSTVLQDWLDWPGVGQVMRRCCERVRVATGEVERETSYAVTSLTPEQAGPEALEGYWRGHWSIENKVHYVRDVTMGEDAGQAYTGSTPQAMAALRNGIIGLLRREGWSRIADALRHYSAHPDKALRLIGAI